MTLANGCSASNVYLWPLRGYAISCYKVGTISLISKTKQKNPHFQPLTVDSNIMNGLVDLFPTGKDHSFLNMLKCIRIICL